MEVNRDNFDIIVDTMNSWFTAALDRLDAGDIEVARIYLTMYVKELAQLTNFIGDAIFNGTEKQDS
jgi:hypothetical protein